MIYSMTGFANKLISLEVDNRKINLSLSLKSLNSRFFDINCKLPHTLNQFETEIIKLIKSKLHRGNILFTLYLSDPNAFKSSIEVSINTISAYLNALDKIKKEFKIQGELSISDVLRLPDVFIPEDKGINEDIKNKIFEIIEQLIEQVLQERKKEGDNLQRDLEQRFAFMHDKINEIEKVFEITHSEQKEKVSKKIHEINLENNENIADTQRQAQYLILDKMDITEEIVRFKSHLKNISNLIQLKTQEKGRQLDFTLQELAREINTITAKTPTAQISELAISIKVEIEKSREQVQNIV